MPNIGQGTNKKARHYLPTGFKKFVVHNVKELKLLLMHNRTYCAKIAHDVLTKKRKGIVRGLLNLMLQSPTSLLGCAARRMNEPRPSFCFISDVFLLHLLRTSNIDFCGISILPDVFYLTISNSIVIFGQPNRRIRLIALILAVAFYDCLLQFEIRQSFESFLDSVVVSC